MTSRDRSEGATIDLTTLKSWPAARNSGARAHNGCDWVPSVDDIDELANVYALGGSEGTVGDLFSEHMPLHPHGPDAPAGLSR
ncbi:MULTISPECIES: hypothetical protein [unclassified Mycolicibacterium]|uniref:hypothetical protein n=1 Tax=unclassified Mycolicibacterium TaxID=2636767 RepID=UPI0012DE527F|nr:MULTISPECIES: hypothetical protein [unclassified Mycolicibacterium]MUL80684.1 hypothetical protein [Mycolicibacterium sp. CBMA 329]MUL86451.1 hypothetical protein [Mycolicibacterium sp. CBMA 331]MUM01313.1 hypothetical protein [Mycolicibacterium sp. CBMA 334]MUM29049.1 hypothetical protein [Mycolicibacterium sp. CBMA 295]MUM36747.1 hypothetical protein [Mycolicibacterium sp. CBMA 247]